MHLAKSDEAAHQKSCGHQERERKRDFGYHQRVAESSVTKTASETFASVAERLVQIFARGFQCGNQAKHQGGEDRYGKSEQEDWQVQTDYGFGRNNVRRHQRDDKSQAN